MKWLLREVISKARDLRFLFGRQDFELEEFRITLSWSTGWFQTRKQKQKKNWSETRWKRLDFLQWQTGEGSSSQNWILNLGLPRGRRKIQNVPWGLTRGLLSLPKGKRDICNQPFWLEIRFPVAHLGPYGSGRARERETDVMIAFYHKKEPNYGDRAMGWVKTRWAKAKRLECKLVVSGELRKGCGRVNERVNRRSEEVRTGSVFPHNFGKQSTNGKPNGCN